MRFLIKTTPNLEIVPFSYQQKLLGVFHKWLGEENPLHDALSLYSFSWLECGKEADNGLTFEQGALWTISFWDAVHLKTVLNGISASPELFSGMKVTEVMFDFEKQFRDGSARFLVGSPIFLKKSRADKGHDHLTTHSPEADQMLTSIMQKKLIAAGLTPEIEIKLDPEYHKIKTKLVTINGIENKSFYCPVIIKGSGEGIKFARTVGVGHSTGSGFGFIR